MVPIQTVNTVVLTGGTTVLPGVTRYIRAAILLFTLLNVHAVLDATD